MRRPFLNDTASQKVDGKDYYPVRQAAYLALMLLGETVEEPKAYYPKIRTFEFQTGFEDSVYFPFGNWKCLKQVF